MRIFSDKQAPHEQLAKLALLGTALGDSFGQCFFNPQSTIAPWLAQQQLPPAPWYFTDDTIMTIGVVQHLLENGVIAQDRLASIWATNYQKNISRGYGGTAHKILREIGEGRPWQETSQEVFSGMGSMGNGAAMRVAPIGAFYPHDMPRVISQAKLSAEITHAHEEAQAGAIAVAVAAHLACYTSLESNALLEKVAGLTPSSSTKNKIVKSLSLPPSYRIETIVHALGNGHQMLSQDSVPLALWCAAHHMNSFTDALWRTVSALGDRDTTCAITGGIVALRVKAAGLSAPWIEATEPITEEWLV